MLTIAITGSTGLIGTRLIELLNKDFQFIEILQQEVDITDKDSLWNKIKSIDFDIFFHMAAYTNVDGAEKEKKLVYAINVEGTKNIFDMVLQKNRKMIYVSTDFVFDGSSPPYYEDSKPNPIGYYAQTKYKGEMMVKDRAMIIRPSYPYRKSFVPKKDFVRNIKYLLEQKKPLSMMMDALITPTFIDDIAFAMKYLFQNFTPEIFHIVGANSLSPYDAGKLIAKTFHLDTNLILPTTYEEYSKGKAKRSRYSEIKSKKNTFYRMKTFEEGLRQL